MSVAHTQAAHYDSSLVPPVSRGLPLGAAEQEGQWLGGSLATGLQRVLVVEDDPVLLDLYYGVLADMKLAVDGSHDGYDALGKLSTLTYDLVITDLNLPGLDGIALLQWIQRHRPTTASVVISGDGSPGRILDAMRGGARDYLVKPFAIEELLRVVERWTKPRRAADQAELFSALMKQVMHDVGGEALNLEAMIRLLQRGKFGAMDPGVSEALRTMYLKLEELKAIAAEYCVLAKLLSHNGGSLPSERLGLKRDVIIPIVSETQGAAERKGLSVSCNRDLDPGCEDDAYVLGNRVMLRCAFRTLFSNAIKYSREAGRISYGISSNGRRYKIHVENEGEVIPVHLRTSLFEEFVQAAEPGAAADPKPGLGLGLALAKDILRRHGGDLWYEPLDNGSKFVCTLPSCPALSEPPSITPPVGQ